MTSFVSSGGVAYLFLVRSRQPMSRVMFYASIVSGLIAVLLRLDSKEMPVAFPAISFAFALVHFATTLAFLRIVRSPFRWLILLWTAVIVVAAFEDFRMLSIEWEFRN